MLILEKILSENPNMIGDVSIMKIIPIVIAMRHLSMFFRDVSSSIYEIFVKITNLKNSITLKMSRSEKFWLEEPQDIIARGTILPSHKDSFEEKLNAVTRLIIIITIILALVKWRHWQVFLALALILIVVVYLNRGPSLIEHFDEDLKDFSYYKDKPVEPVIIEKEPEPVIEERQEEIEVPVEELFTYWKGPEIEYIPKRNFVVANGRK